MDEHTAEKKIRIARLILRIPSLIEELEKGALNVSLLELALGCAYREKLSDEELEEALRHPVLHELPCGEAGDCVALPSSVRGPA